jgi:uncharacterized membrane protein
MKNEKGLKYYGVIFLVSVAAVALFIGFNLYRGTDMTLEYTVGIAFVPFTFTLILFVTDRLIQAFMPRKETEMDAYEKFLIESTELLKNDENFEIEDFKKLRESERFQRTLKQIYNIKTSNESEELNYKMVKKRFKKDTLEYRAVIKIIE